MTKTIAREKAAQAWCTSKTKNIEMDPDLCDSFANILLKECRKPYLGLVSTTDLLQEIKERINAAKILTKNLLNAENEN